MTSLSYQDVYLTPRYSELRSRSDADISVEFLGRKFKAPWVPANMASVIDERIACKLSQDGYFYIMHRFGDNRAFVKKANVGPWRFISVSVGVKEEDKEFLKWVVRNRYRVDSICIDVAHGHHILVKEMVEYIKGLNFHSHWSDYVSVSWAMSQGVCSAGRAFASIPLEYKPKIIAGNVCTPEAVRDLASWGTDAVKVGIAGGHACSTKNMTGFHIPMFSCVQRCYDMGGIGQLPPYDNRPYYGDGVMIPDQKALEEARKKWRATVPIIADGGIRESGDIAKALTAGATMVMAGSIFAACTDAPGENVYGQRKVYHTDTGVHESKGPITHKKYFGSASAKQKGNHTHVEGFEVEIPCNGLTYTEKYAELTDSLQSAVSYAGGKDLSAFKDVRWVSVK